MITDKQIKEASGKELERLAGEVLQPETKTCDLEHVTCSLSKPQWKCKKCGESCDCKRLWPCKFADPISITGPEAWPNAMKWRDWAVAEYGRDMFTDALLDIWRSLPDGSEEFCDWLSFEAQPEHYLKAAMLCKVRSGK